jgi:pimeloyl-ACP methyl ester carboxylesterase
VPELDWQPCGEGFPGYECATATVPLDYDHPHGATTSLALARYPATDKANRIGSIFVNPGGPGGSGIALVLGGFGPFLSEGVDGRFDIVGFDPRGVGASDPLHCFDSGEDLIEFAGSVPVFPYKRDQYAPFFNTLSSLGRRCLDGTDPIARHMSTADVARDLDLLRQAVGDRKLSFSGASYGSYIGNTYANLFPDKVRAIVIDGVLDPRLWSSGFQIRSDRVATQQEFDEFLRLCDAAGEACAFTAPGGSARRWEALARAVRAEPIDFEGEPYTYDFLIADGTAAMYSPESWGGPDGWGAFFDLLADIALGDQPGAVAEANRLRQALHAQLRPAAVPEPDYPNGFDSYFGNQCADTQYPHTLFGFLLGDLYARAGSRFGPYWWWTNAGCARWPVNRDRYVGPWTARTSSPVLVVGNLFDGVTAYTGAQATARLLPNSRLLTYAGWGHTAYGRSACVTDHVNEYFVSGTLPPRGTVCPANPNPFLPSTLRSSRDAPRPLLGLPPAWALRP